MKNRTKRFAALLAALIVAAGSTLAMVSCADEGEGDESSTPTETPAETPAETPEESDDIETPEVPDFDFMAEDLTKYITLGRYKDLAISVDEKPTVSDEDIDMQLNYALINAKEYITVTDRAVTKNDTVYIKYRGIMDGEEFEGGTGEQDNFTIFNGGGFIDGFADGIVGATPGVEKAIDLKFPDNYHAELAGKPVTFMVTVVHIYEAKELTDALAIALTEDETMTAAKLREEYKKQIEESIDSEYENYKLDKVWQKIFSEAKELDMPKDLVDGYYNMDVQYYKTYAAMYGITYEEVLGMIGMTDDDIYTRAHDNVFTDMVVYSVIKAENFSITEDEYNEMLKELAATSGYTEKEILETYTKEKLTDMFTYTKVYEMAPSWQNFTVETPAGE